MEEKIVISGIGVVSPIGIGREEVWESLQNGVLGIKPITFFETDKFNTHLGGQVQDNRVQQIVGDSNVRNLDKMTLLSLAASKLALEDAEFEINESNSATVGVVLGTALGSIRSISGFDKQVLTEGPRSIQPGQCPNVVLCSPASQISIKFKIRGFTTTVTSGHNSSFDTIKYAIDLLKKGQVKYALVGAVEELCEETYKGFYYLQLLSGSRKYTKEINAPFDRRRNGFILGEGSVIYLMESQKSAQTRGAKVYAELSGFYQENMPARLIRNILTSKETAGSNFLKDFLPHQIVKNIDFLSLGANSSPIKDALESRFVYSMFKEKANEPFGSAIKSLIGESYSASGAFQLLGALFCMDTNILYPTVGYEILDEDYPADFLITKTMKREVRRSLVCNTDLHKSSYLRVERVD